MEVTNRGIYVTNRVNEVTSHVIEITNLDFRPSKVGFRICVNRAKTVTRNPVFLVSPSITRPAIRR